MKETSKVRKIAFVGDHLPRKCGIATFTSDLLAAVATAHPQSQCFFPLRGCSGPHYPFPTLVLVQSDVMRRVVFDGSFGGYVGVQREADVSWLDTSGFAVPFEYWNA